MILFLKFSRNLKLPLKQLTLFSQSVGYSSVSNTPTQSIIVFHFGLGNDLDLQILKIAAPQLYTQDNPILPGKSYCYLSFQSLDESQKYMENYTRVQQKMQIRYKEIEYQNLKRIFVCFYTYKSETISLENLGHVTNAKTKDCKVPGIFLIENFITKDQQRQIMEQIDARKWQKLSNRKVQHYGYDFKYGKNGIDKDQKSDNPMPEFIMPVLESIKDINLHKLLEKQNQLKQDIKERNQETVKDEKEQGDEKKKQKENNLPEYIPYTFDQLTINNYYPGHGIPAHFDTHSPFQEIFCAISLLSGITMQWRSYTGEQISMYLPERSMVIFTGEGRYAWTHAISSRKIDIVDNRIKHRSRRVSLTLRKIRFIPCQCPYYFYCDSQGYDQNTMKKNNPLLKKYINEKINKEKLSKCNPKQIYKKYVIDAYNGFGFDFHNRQISLVKQFLNKVIENKSNDTFFNVLDVGCGNGEYKNLFSSGQFFNHYIGIQICPQMSKFQDKILMDGLNLSFRRETFTLILCIAVLHHLPSPDLRLKMLRNLYEGLQNEGYLILTVFNYANKKDIYADKDILLSYSVSNEKIIAKERQQSIESVQNHDNPAEKLQHFSGANQKLQEKSQNKQSKQVQQIDQKHQQQQEIEKNLLIENKTKIFDRYYHLFQIDQICQLLKQCCFIIQEIQTDKQNIVILCKKQNKINTQEQQKQGREHEQQETNNFKAPEQVKTPNIPQTPI